MTGFSITITIFMLFLLLGIVTSIVNKRAEWFIYKSAESVDEYKFRPSKIMYTIVACNFIISLFFSILPFYFSIRDFISLIILLGISAIFALIGVTTIIMLHRAYVRIDREVIEYYSGMRLVTVRRNEVKLAYSSNGHIIVETGVIPRMAIPMIFKDSAKILSLAKNSHRNTTTP